jgi:hypothetical protein
MLILLDAQDSPWQKHILLLVINTVLLGAYEYIEVFN